MRTKFFLTVAVLGALSLNYGLLTHIPFTYYQIKSLVFAEFLLIGVLVWLIYDLTRKPYTSSIYIVKGNEAEISTKGIGETIKTVEWLGNTFEVVKGNECTDCHFLKDCQFLKNSEVANRFLDATGVNCMMDEVYFVKVEPKTYDFKGEKVKVTPSVAGDNDCAKCCFVKVCGDYAVRAFEQENGLDCEAQNHYYEIVNQ